MTKFLAPFLLLAAAAAAQNTPIAEEIPTSQLPGGLKGEITMLAKNANMLSIAVKITNEATSRGDAHVLLYGPPSVFDDTGIRYQVQGIQSVTGVAYCQGPMSLFRLCVGVPRMDQNLFFPLQGYTDIEPGKAVTVHFSLNGGGQSIGKGSVYSLAEDIAYRFANFDKDGAMSDAEKKKSLHFASLSFTGAKPLMPDVKSSIRFDR